MANVAENNAVNLYTMGDVNTHNAATVQDISATPAGSLERQLDGAGTNDTGPDTGIEPLDDELVAYLITDPVLGACLKHPLLYSICHQPAFNRYVNAQYRSKLDALAGAVEREDWHNVVFLHERPYRLGALTEYSDEMDDATFWSLVAAVWIDSENIGELADDWDMTLNADRPHRELMMSDADREELAGLDDIVVVYQGRTDVRDDGWSWTVDRNVATWFAQRFEMLETARGMVATTTVRRDDIVAYLGGRGEREVLIDPRSLGDVSVVPLHRTRPGT